MKKSKTKTFKVIPNPELVRVSAGFRPMFGNDEDIDILKRAKQLDEELKKIDNKMLRGDKAKHTKKMSDVLFLENALIYAINKRNMDF